MSPFVFLTRLSDVLDDEVAALGADFGDQRRRPAWWIRDHALVRFLPPGAGRRPSLARRTTGLGEHLTDAVRAVARENPRLQGVIGKRPRGRWGPAHAPGSSSRRSRHPQARHKVGGHRCGASRHGVTPQPTSPTGPPPARARFASPSPACRAGSRACGGCA